MAITQKPLENTSNAAWKHLWFSGHEVEVSNTVSSWGSVNNTDFIETENIFFAVRERWPECLILSFSENLRTRTDLRDENF